MSEIAIVYFSGYGHTQKQAEAVQQGAGGKATLIRVNEEGKISDAEWELLDNAKAIVFGSPTYMGGVAWQFKRFADDTSKRWFTAQWKDKLGAGFTNSASMNGDKGVTIHYLMTLAMQHGMIWAGVGMLPANSKSADRNDPNWLGASAGLLAQSPSDSSPDEGPLPGDLKTAEMFGERLAGLVEKF